MAAEPTKLEALVFLRPSRLQFTTGEALAIAHNEIQACFWCSAKLCRHDLNQTLNHGAGLNPKRGSRGGRAGIKNGPYVRGGNNIHRKKPEIAKKDIPRPKTR